MATFLLVTHGTAGDVLPFARIGRSLADRGHEVTLCTHAPYAPAAARAGLGFAAIDTEASYLDGQRRSAELLAVRSPADLRRYYEEAGLFEQMRHEVALLAERHRPGETVLVGRHTSALSVLIAADLLAAPAVWVAVAPTQLLVAPVAAANVARGLADGVNGVRSDAGLPPITEWGRWLRSPGRTIGLWPQWFEDAGTATRAVLTGFVTGDEFPAFADSPAGLPPGVEALLGGDRRPVLVTGGTGQLLHARFYAVALEAVAGSGRTALVVAPERELLPASLPPDVHHFPRLPFPAVLPRVAALLHHGGIGTAARALRSATPQVIMAYGADRPDNAERLAAHGLARWTPEHEWSAPAIAAQLDEALADPGHRDRVARFNGEPESSGPARAAELLEGAGAVLQAGS
ncbi:glycosyltransferase family 1 protein [Streptosporangiaceae bacterium NEAU-GS5]|nr:glycosyltransferase family 1 protein [Streptosporangiaceae bacterium NEAU-GS5]